MHESDQQKRVLRTAIWTTVFLLSATSCGNRDGNDATTVETPTAVGTYVPADPVATSWGTFDYYRSHATFAAFAGHVTLEDAGRLPAAAGEELAGAQVFKIVNADEHYQQNRGRDGICLSAPRWLAVKPIAVPAGEPQRIRVALLMLEDWSTFAPGRPGFCGSAVYAAS